MKTILVSISFIAILVSCNNGLPKEKISAIDNLATKVDSFLVLYASIDSSKAIGNAKAYQDNLNYLRSELKDTVSREMGMYLGKYYRLHKSMEYIKSQYAPIKVELMSSQQQLKDLKYDAVNGMVNEEQFKRYIALENGNAEKAIASTKKILKLYDVCTREYKEMSPRVDSLIDANKKKVENN